MFGVEYSVGRALKGFKKAKNDLVRAIDNGQKRVERDSELIRKKEDKMAQYKSRKLANMQSTEDTMEQASRALKGINAILGEE